MKKRIYDKEVCVSQKILFYFFVLNEEFLSVTKYINGREEKKSQSFLSPFLSFPKFLPLLKSHHKILIKWLQ